MEGLGGKWEREKWGTSRLSPVWFRFTFCSPSHPTHHLEPVSEKACVRESGEVQLAAVRDLSSFVLHYGIFQ